MESPVDRLHENNVVTISLPICGGYRVVDFEAAVLALIESGIVLRPLNVDAVVLPERADDVFLTFEFGGQLIGLKGELTWRGQQGGLRFQVADGVLRHRSRYTRVEAELSVTVACAGGADRYAGTTVNVAPEGLLVRAPLAVELGETLELDLSVPGHPEPVRLLATVVRHGGGLFAVHFPGDPRARAVIAEFVVEQRAAQALAPAPG